MQPAKKNGRTRKCPAVFYRKSPYSPVAGLFSPLLVSALPDE
jgi:hypothetical protein